MTEQEIRAHGMHLVGAIVNGDDKQAQSAGVALAVNVLVDLNRIADALCKLAAKGIEGR